ncbi:hypothetical protein ASG73_08870 [Janibacter sp. Soil728]|uniref:hypothetical protein n=1 Tax=Janibacter sp. Soil728 TaxID=1736393 RepID=UPI0006F2B407|nr:hypothetical protein [Janibacter sp. Soil728]KRE37745.1 hypothetical protein ASG73_08870 [Janibacter sp. Soil728]
MSSSPNPAPRPAHPALFISLVGDAALFPPAALTMADALSAHARHRSGPHADVVGPFLVGVPAVTDLAAALDAGSPAPPAIGLVARPGTAIEDIVAAFASLREEPRTRLTSIDMAWQTGWRSIDPGDLPIHLEVDRTDPDAALSDIASASDFADVRAKFRTGATAEWAWPDAAELAAFVLAAGRHYVPFVLTGGLHHAVRGDHGVDTGWEPQHGLLNVLVAVHASAGGADERTVSDLLEVREAEPLAQIVRGWSASDVAAVRASFAGYGCCDVTDPIGELTALGVLSAPEA